jgi:hypothetical protein
MKEPRIRQMLDLSTDHLPLACRVGDFPLGIVAYTFEEGYMLWVPDEPALPDNDHTDENNDEGEPYASAYQAIRWMQHEARKLGCDFIMFDRDGDVLDAWPTFDDPNEQGVTYRQIQESGGPPFDAATATGMYDHD